MADWKVGDRCYCGFKLGTVRQVASDGRVMEFSDGCGLLSGYDLRSTIQPFSPAVKALSAEFAGYYRQIYKMCNGLNMPDISQWLTQRWMEACDGGNIVKIRIRIEDLKNLITKTLTIDFEGVRIIR